MKSSLLCALFFCVMAFSAAVQSAIPERFQGDDPNSKLTISYDDLDVFLAAHVLKVGPSTREKAAAAESAIGTKLRVKINRYTVLEGNRFFFENLKDPGVKSILTDLKTSLESLPAEVPMKLLSLDDQLAYWLNLYNFALLEQLADIYPKSSLKRVLDYGDEDSILAQKILNVAGVPLSLNDIHFNILKEKFSASPLIIYGLFQGNIGGPNIRAEAYTADNVWKLLERNAINFVNSNRGTFYGSRSSMRASVLYKHNMAFFENDNAKLKAHLQDYLVDELSEVAANAKKVKTDIKDWSFADLFGNTRQFGGGYHTNAAALLDSVKATQPGENGQPVQIQSYLSDDIQSKVRLQTRFNDMEIKLLMELKQRYDANMGTVTIKDLEQQ